MSKYPIARDCKYCGKPFLIMDGGHARKMYCSDECHNAQRTKDKAKTRSYTKGAMPFEQARKIEKKKHKDLIDFTVEARKHGMTYGQWQQAKYLAENKHNWGKKK